MGGSDVTYNFKIFSFNLNFFFFSLLSSYTQFTFISCRFLFQSLDLVSRLSSSSYIGFYISLSSLFFLQSSLSSIDPSRFCEEYQVFVLHLLLTLLLYKFFYCRILKE